MNYLRGFAPWLCYAALSAFDWRVGMSAAAAVAVILLLDALRRRGVDLLQTATCVFFVVMAVIALADPASALNRWTCPLANAALAVTALGSLVAGRPFTLSITRERVQKELWDNPRFIHFNKVLTGIWATAFSLAAIVSAVIVGTGSAPVALVTTQVLAFVVPFIVGSRYAARAQASAAGARMEPTA